MAFRREWLACGAVAFFAMASNACAPVTPYRYTGVVPAARPIPWDGRTAPAGSLRIEGTISHAAVIENQAPVEHDTALRVPETTVDGAVFLAPVKYFEIGVRYSYAAYSWTADSAYGTEPLPSHPSVWGVGAEFHGSIPLDKKERFHLGIAANVMRYETPFAEWTLTGAQSMDNTPLCTIGPTCTQDPDYANVRYQLFAEQNEAHLALNGALVPSVGVGDNSEYGNVFALLDVHTAFKNDGFTNSSSNGSTIDTDGYVWMLGAGYSFNLEPVHAAAAIYVPFTNQQSAVNYGVGGFLTLGVDIELWEGKEAREKKERERKEREEKDRLPPPPPRVDPIPSPDQSAPQTPIGPPPPPIEPQPTSPTAPQHDPPPAITPIRAPEQTPPVVPPPPPAEPPPGVDYVDE